MNFDVNQSSVLIKAQFAAIVLGLGVACSPVFNWRDVRFDATGTTVLLPCKPDRAERPVPLYDGSGPLTLQMAGCQAGGATFSVSVVQLPVGASEAATQASLARWQQATQISLKSTASERMDVSVKGAALAYSVQSRIGEGATAQVHQAVYALRMGPGPAVLLQAQLLGSPKGDSDGPSALSAEAQSTFLSGLAL